MYDVGVRGGLKQSNESDFFYLDLLMLREDEPNNFFFSGRTIPLPPRP